MDFEAVKIREQSCSNYIDPSPARDASAMARRLLPSTCSRHRLGLSKGENIMKGRRLVWICLLAAAHASASSSDAHQPAAAVSLAGNVGSAPAARFISQSPAFAAPSPTFTAQSPAKANKLRHRPVQQANLADIGGGVVKEMKATSDFAQEHVAKAGAADSWLIALSGFGLVILQLRRKHKSLPQRRIAPYA